MWRFLGIVYNTEVKVSRSCERFWYSQEVWINYIKYIEYDKTEMKLKLLNKPHALKYTDLYYFEQFLNSVPCSRNERWDCRLPRTSPLQTPTRIAYSENVRRRILVRPLRLSCGPGSGGFCSCNYGTLNKLWVDVVMTPGKCPGSLCVCWTRTGFSNSWTKNYSFPLL